MIITSPKKDKKLLQKMCRIAGILHPFISVTSLQKTVLEMCDLLKHGGPDDEGIFTATEDQLVLGNRRLSLMDLSTAGHQPMQYNGRYIITYNGELYNFAALKKRLIAAGMCFTTNSDTEVILAAFAKWKTQSFKKLNGMFAFALWDKEEKKLYLVRDPAGIKPLYYSTHNGGLAFASEMRGFSPVSYLQEKTPNAAVFQLAYGFIPEPVTTLSNVQPLPKGTYLEYDCKSHLTSLQVYSFFSFSNNITNEKEATGIIHNTMQDAVDRQMLADEQVGVFLSGGIDSSIIAKLASKQSTKKLHSLSIYFDEPSYSEKKYQDIIANEINSTHHAILLKEHFFHEHLSAVFKAMDMPTCDGINTWFISKFAASVGLKAVLSGIGADELFGGYPSFTRIQKALFMQNFPKKLLQLSGKSAFKKYRRLAYLRIEGVRGIYLFLRGHFTPVEIAAQLGSYEKDIWEILESKPISPSLEKVTSKNLASWMEFNIYMQDQILRDADVMSMAHGLEIRVPFLDNEIINTVFSIKENIKFNGNIPKQLLIKSFNSILPETIWKRPKMGFSFPFNEWLKNSDFVKELTTDKNINTQKIAFDFLNGKEHWSKIMTLISMKN